MEKECAYATDDEYDPLNTMLTLNMAIVSIQRILSTEDRIVLDQEYQNIINNLSLGNIASDTELTNLFKNLMDFITEEILDQEESRRFQERYNRNEQDRLVNTLVNLRAYGGNSTSFLGSLGVACISAYFDYQSDKSKLLEGLNNDLWQLKKDYIKRCNALQTELLTASWNLLRKYHLPDKYRLVQSGMIDFYKAVNEKDPAKRLRMLRVLEDNFSVYPPYWYYRGKTAQLQKNNEQEVKYCFEQFDKVWRPVLRQDPYKLEVEKYRVQELAESEKTNEQVNNSITTHLEYITQNTPKGDWSNTIFVGIAYFLIGNKDRAISCIEANVDFEYERGISNIILEHMRKGELQLSILPNELNVLVHRNAVTSNVEDSELAAILTDYFEGNDKEAKEILFEAAEKSTTPAILVARMMIEIGENKFDPDKMLKMNEQVKALMKIKPNTYNGLFPLVEHYANQGNMRARNYLAAMYSEGWGVKQDVQKSIEILSRNAQQGDTLAQVFLGAGVYYFSEEFKDYEKAVYWLNKAKNTSTFAQVLLASMYLEGEKYGIKKDIPLGIDLITMAAERGLSYAQLLLGLAYMNGTFIEKDIDKAKNWLIKAAEQELPEAQQQLGYLYALHEGDYTNAIKYLTQAANQGLATAQMNLGNIYLEGRGIESDPLQAANWFYKAAAQGNIEAQIALATMYTNGIGVKQDDGIGVKQDDSMAFEWLLKVAEQGLAEAQEMVAYGYEIGKGTRKNSSEAVKWYEKAFEQKGTPNAALSLAQFYENGEGVTKSIKTAYMYYSYVLLCDDANSNMISTAEQSMHRLEGKNFVSNFLSGMTFGIWDGPNLSPQISDWEIRSAREEAKHKYDKIRKGN